MVGGSFDNAMGAGIVASVSSGGEKVVGRPVSRRVQAAAIAISMNAAAGTSW